MEWFVLLKDIRDYLAHFGAVEFSIKEINSTTLCIEMFNGIEINAFIKAIYTGFNELLVFLDNHCSSVVLDAENAEAI